MVLVSIHPFAFRKIFLLAAAILGLSSAFCFGDSLFMARHYEHGRRPQLVIQPLENFPPNAIQPALHWLDMKNFEAFGAVAPVVTTGFDEEGNHGLAARIEDRPCKMPVCLYSRVGLTSAWAASQHGGIGSF